MHAYREKTYSRGNWLCNRTSLVKSISKFDAGLTCEDRLSNPHGRRAVQPLGVAAFADTYVASPKNQQARGSVRFSKVQT